MGQFSFDVSLGREVEFYSRVDSNDPTNAALILAVLSTDGLDADNVLKTFALFSTLLAANDEVDNSGYARKTLTDADIAAYTVDTTTHTITLFLPQQTFSTIGTGDAWSKWVLGYDSDTTSGTDANIVPICAGDLRIDGSAVIPNGNDIIIAWPDGLLTSR